MAQPAEMGGFINELCSPQSLDDGHSTRQNAFSSTHKDEAIAVEESVSSASLGDQDIEQAFMAEAELHLRRTHTARLLATWHKETRILLTGAYLKMHNARVVQVPVCPAMLCTSEALLEQDEHVLLMGPIPSRSKFPMHSSRMNSSQSFRQVLTSGMSFLFHQVMIDLDHE